MIRKGPSLKHTQMHIFYIYILYIYIYVNTNKWFPITSSVCRMQSHIPIALLGSTSCCKTHLLEAIASLKHRARSTHAVHAMWDMQGPNIQNAFVMAKCGMANRQQTMGTLFSQHAMTKHITSVCLPPDLRCVGLRGHIMIQTCKWHFQQASMRNPRAVLTHATAWKACASGELDQLALGQPSIPYLVHQKLSCPHRWSSLAQ